MTKTQRHRRVWWWPAAGGVIALGLGLWWGLGERGDAREGLMGPVPSPFVAEPPLVERTLSGLRVSLPEWSAAREALDPASGLLQLVAPNGRDELKLTWTPTPLPSREELMAMVPTMSPHASLKESIPVQVAGSTTDILVIDLDGKGRLLHTTQWACPGDPRTFTLFSYIAASPSSVLELHRRVLGSVRCEEPPVLTAAYPEPTQPGLQRIEVPGGLVYATADGEEVLFTPGFAEPAAVAAFSESVALRRQMVELFVGTLDEGALATAELRGPLHRRTWSGTGRDPSGAPVHVVVALLPCPGSTFIGMHMSPAAPRDEVVDVLVQARCPS